jgi:hypothetical protein
MATPLLSSQWPVWTNPRIVLFHGTNASSATNIVKAGVDLSRCKSNSDFGMGFYTTTNRNQAWAFARRSANAFAEQPGVVRMAMDRARLGNLLTMAFVLASPDSVDFWSLVSHCRRGAAHIPAPGSRYDIVYGPVARIWRGPANSEVWKGYDQVSFHTAEAVSALNDGSHCSREVDSAWLREK